MLWVEEKKQTSLAKLRNSLTEALVAGNYKYVITDWKLN
jgi:hypothetical protein